MCVVEGGEERQEIQHQNSHHPPSQGHRCPPPLQSALNDAATNNWPILLLFPGPDAIDVNDAATSTPPALAAGLPPGGTHAHPHYLLIVIDGTWRHAKQLFTAAAPFLLRGGGEGRGPAVRVGLPIGQAAAPTTPPTTRNLCTETGTITLFKEPMPGCMTTSEAVARAVGVLEPPAEDGSPCPAAAAILAALHAVVDAQKRHDPAVIARCGGGGEAVTRAKARFGFRSAPPSDRVVQATPWKVEGGRRE